MLSVKHISLSGSETILSATRVEYHPEPVNGVPTQLARLTVFGGPDQQELHGGTVFVMNEAGKTISRYDLGARCVALAKSGVEWKVTGGSLNGLIYGSGGADTARVGDLNAAVAR